MLLTEQISPRYIVETIARERLSAVFLLVPWAVDLLNALDRKEVRIEEYDLELLASDLHGCSTDTAGCGPPDQGVLSSHGI